MSAHAVLRHLLRAVDKHITSVSGNALWRDAVLEQFRRHRQLRDPVLVQQELEKARDYADMIANIAYHKVSPPPSPPLLPAAP
jgi:hypothetical protein